MGPPGAVQQNGISAGRSDGSILDCRCERIGETKDGVQGKVRAGLNAEHHRKTLPRPRPARQVAHHREPGEMTCGESAAGEEKKDGRESCCENRAREQEQARSHRHGRDCRGDKTCRGEQRG